MTTSRFQTVLGDAGPAIFLAKLAGAAAGSFVSIAYILPRGRREAFLRFSVGVVFGFTFGTTIGLKIADQLGVLDKLDSVDVALMGSTLASACAWWGLGVIQRFAEASPNSIAAALKGTISSTAKKDK